MKRLLNRGQVKSEKGKASTIATGIVSASNSITTAGTVTRDKTSYYTANTVGRKLIINEASIAQNIQSKISEFVKLIHGVANEFEVVDENISTMWQNNLSSSQNKGTTGLSSPYTNPSFVPQNNLFKE